MKTLLLMSLLLSTATYAGEAADAGDIAQQQEQIAQDAAGDAAIAKARETMASGDWWGGFKALLTEKFWTIVGLVLVGSFAGIGTTSIFKRAKPPLDDASPDVRVARLWLYSMVGTASGGLWALVAITTYLSAALGIGLLIAVTLALGLAAISGAITPKIYDLLDALWSWFYGRLLPAAGDMIVRRLKKMFGKE